MKISLVAAALFVAPGVHANDEIFALKVQVENNKSIRFFINEAKDIALSINDAADNRIIYEENIHATAASTKTYDLNALPNGDYFLSVQSDAQVAQYEIHIEDNKAEVSAPKITPVLKPVLVKNGGEITLSLDNADKGPIEVQIVDEYNDELYKEVFTNKSKLIKKFNVSKTPASQLTFIIKTKSHEVAKTIESR